MTDEIAVSRVEESNEVCREHHWPRDEPSPFHRCLICSIKEEYRDRGLAQLNSWSKEEIASEHERWERMMESYKCKPHVHTDGGYKLVSDLEAKGGSESEPSGSDTSGTAEDEARAR